MYENYRSPGIEFGKGLIGAASSYFSTKEQSKTARRNTDKTNQANRALAEYQYSKDLEMWRLQNEYNTPQAQMQRFKDAGLNPHLMYGQGDSGNASQMPKYNAPRMDYAYKPDVNPMQMLSEFLNLQQQSAQIDNIQAQTDKTRHDSVTSKWLSHISYMDFGLKGEERTRKGKVHDLYMLEDKGAMAEFQAQMANWSAETKKLAGIQLKNAYQVELNRLIEQGLAPGDDYKLRIGLSILNALGINTAEFTKKLDKNYPKQAKKPNKHIKTVPKEWEKFQ